MVFAPWFRRSSVALLSGASDMMHGPVSRRMLLKAAGVTLALPLLESAGRALAAPPEGEPKRFLAMCFALGLHGPNVFPKETGRGYELTPYLKALGGDAVRDNLTVISGLSHPDVTL